MASKKPLRRKPATMHMSAINNPKSGMFKRLITRDADGGAIKQVIAAKIIANVKSILFLKNRLITIKELPTIATALRHMITLNNEKTIQEIIF